MKNMDRQMYKKGQTLLEIIAVLVIIGAILAAVIPAVTASTDSGRINSALSAIRSIQSAAVSYYNASGGTYAGISISALATKYLPISSSATVISNPWSGSISIAENGATTSQYVITMTSVPTSVQTQISNALQNNSLGASFSGTTLTAIFS